MHLGNSKIQRISATIAVVASLLPAAGTAADPPPTSITISAVSGHDPAVDWVRAADCASNLCDQASGERRFVLAPASGLGATLVQLPGYSLPGQPSRPRHGLGIRSHQLEAALNDVGIEARHCLAPVVRMHTKLSSGFNLSGTLWVYLRCTFE